MVDKKTCIPDTKIEYHANFLLDAHHFHLWRYVLGKIGEENMALAFCLGISSLLDLMENNDLMDGLPCTNYFDEGVNPIHLIADKEYPKWMDDEKRLQEVVSIPLTKTLKEKFTDLMKEVDFDDSSEVFCLLIRYLCFLHTQKIRNEKILFIKECPKDENKKDENSFFGDSKTYKVHELFGEYQFPFKMLH